MRKKICLNMIVKDERDVICRSLGSIRSIIDYWVIVDTGSSDGTQSIIRQFMQGIPGELHERPWVHFEHNRNEALQLAKGKADYFLFIDADEEFVFEKDFIMPDLNRDFYIVSHQIKDSDFQRISLIRNDSGWAWTGVIHETIDHPRLNQLNYGYLPKVVNIYHEKGGNRAKDPDKCLKDAAVLEKAIQEDPDNSRYVFYLAQSYFEANQPDRALKVYEKRIEMEGNEQERFWSYYRIAIIQEFHLKQKPAVYLKSYAKAFVHRPTRVEPLYYIASYYFNSGKFRINYLLIKIALSIPPSTDVILIERWMHDWAFSYQLLQSAYNLGYYQESLDIAKKLLAANNLPMDRRDPLKKILGLIHRMANQTDSPNPKTSRFGALDPVSIIPVSRANQ
jgi:glycosyltransferase involved in cell wall biosynthesis